MFLCSKANVFLVGISRLIQHSPRFDLVFTSATLGLIHTAAVEKVTGCQSSGLTLWLFEPQSTEVCTLNDEGKAKCASFRDLWNVFGHVAHALNAGLTIFTSVLLWSFFFSLEEPQGKAMLAETFRVNNKATIASGEVWRPAGVEHYGQPSFDVSGDFHSPETENTLQRFMSEQ